MLGAYCILCDLPIAGVTTGQGVAKIAAHASAVDSQTLALLLATGRSAKLGHVWQVIKCQGCDQVLAA